MLIDWFTVVAQAINFLILVWLMKRFLYGPILKAIDAREAKIAAELADADARRAEAQQERDEFSKNNAEFARQRSGLIDKATEEVESLRERLIGEARQAADELASKRRESMQAEARNLNTELLQRTQAEVFAIARKALADLAGASLEEQVTEVFVQRLQEISSSVRADLLESLKSTAEPAVVRSAFTLPEMQRRAIQQAINESFAREAPVTFETAPDLIGGIELTTGGTKLAWSIDDYLGSLEEGIGELLYVNQATESDSETEPETKLSAASST